MLSWLVLGVVTLVSSTTVGATRWLRNRPRRRTSARDRLLQLNPTLSDPSLTWSRSARRVDVGRLVRLLVVGAVVAALTVVGRPTATPVGDVR